VDLQEDSKFASLGTELVSVAADHPDSWKDVAAEYGIEPGDLVSDPYNRVADRYGVMRWRVPPTADVDSAEPGHTFVLVGEDGTVEWIRDYGAPENGGLMYVEPAELLRDMQGAIQEVAEGR
jgi:peroxiredoxin